MSQLDETQQHQIPVGSAGRREARVDWAVLVILLAASCTLTWALFWLWVIAHGLRIALL
jgi:hypothetical protein